MTTSGSLTEFPVPTNFGNDDIVAGSAGNLWYASNQSAIVLVRTSNGVVTATKKINTGPGQPNGITVGPDTHIWFTDLSTDTVNRLKKPLP
jgi:virginiamycin B lyase